MLPFQGDAEKQATASPYRDYTHTHTQVEGEACSGPSTKARSLVDYRVRDRALELSKSGTNCCLKGRKKEKVVGVKLK